MLSGAVTAEPSILVTGRGGLQGCEMLRIPHCLDSQLRNGDKAVSPTYRQRSTPWGGGGGEGKALLFFIYVLDAGEC
jgi:hypothetical protein